MCSTVTVFSLSVYAYVGAPPITRSVASGQPNNVGKVRSHVGSTTRNRDQPSQAQNSNVPRPSRVPHPSRTAATVPAQPRQGDTARPLRPGLYTTRVRACRPLM
jgi:hypothetical protein